MYLYRVAHRAVDVTDSVSARADGLVALGRRFFDHAVAWYTGRAYRLVAEVEHGDFNLLPRFHFKEPRAFCRAATLLVICADRAGDVSLGVVDTCKAGP